MKILASAAFLLLLTAPVLASDIITLEVAESEEFGQYLTDNQGRPVYAFLNDAQATDEHPAEVSCTSAECADAWPLVSTSPEPRAGDGVDASRLGTIEHDSLLVVTYDGWPLYYSAHDKISESPQHGALEAFGGEWTLLGPGRFTGAADLAAGEEIYADACAQCHGRAGRGMASFPSLGGREADYIAAMLRQYRAGETVGPNSALMRPVAAVLSDEDISNLGAFIAEEFQ